MSRKAKTHASLPVDVAIAGYLANIVHSEPLSEQLIAIVSGQLSVRGRKKVVSVLDKVIGQAPERPGQPSQEQSLEEQIKTRILARAGKDGENVIPIGVRTGLEAALKAEVWGRKGKAAKAFQRKARRLYQVLKSFSTATTRAGASVCT
jgi:hypothetical protein